MKSAFHRSASCVVGVLAIACAALPAHSAAEKISSPGKYEGYSTATYDGTKLISQYVAVRDGTRLAVDVFLPTRAGTVAAEKLPVLFMHTPYNRRNGSGGLTAETYPGEALKLAKFGYIIAVADFRGVFASFGANGAYNRGEWLDAARWDAYDLIEWLAKQSWSDGKVGLWGCSATGGSQMQAITSRPPSLKAAFPMSCEFDAYAFRVPGGVQAPNRFPMAKTGDIPERDRAGVAVDADQDRSLLNAALEQHRKNREDTGAMPFRDSVSPTLGLRWWEVSSAHLRVADLNQSGVPMYVTANWDEGPTKHGAAYTYNNITNPKKLLIGPQTHCNWIGVRSDTGFDIVVEEHRFFDYWLKGIDNGVMKEQGVHYYTYNAPAGKEWQSAAQWPLRNERRTKFYLDGTGDGARTLAAKSPTTAKASDAYTTQFSVTPQTRAQSGLTYDTPPLPADLQVTGHPVVDLWVSSSAADGDFVAHIEDVAPDGSTRTYNMYGQLRASLRAVHQAPFNALGLPWHRAEQQDASPLQADEPVHLQFELYPMSYVFKAGHRVRVRILASAEGSPQITPAPVVKIYRDATRNSSVTLPVIG